MTSVKQPPAIPQPYLSFLPPALPKGTKKYKTSKLFQNNYRVGGK
jgi:hypothetical protein